jgi:hypothetical protein
MSGASQCPILDCAQVPKNIVPLSAVIPCSASQRARKKRCHPISHVAALPIENQLVSVSNLITTGAEWGNENFALARIRK